MCLGIGAPGGVKTISDESGKAYGTAIDQAKAEFGDASKVFNDLYSSLSPIAKAGPGQTGRTAQEEAAIDASTVDQTATAYKNASAAVKSGMAAQGGGNIALPSGVNIATEEALAEAGAQQESSGLRENTIENYEQGNKNWEFAEGALAKAPGVFSTANDATGEAAKVGTEAMDDQKTRASYPTWQNVAMGALGTGLNFLSPGSGTLLSGVAKGTPGGPSGTNSEGQDS